MTPTDYLSLDMGGWDAVEENKVEAEQREKIKGISRLFPKTDEELELVFVTSTPYIVLEHFLSNRGSVVCTKRSLGHCVHCGPNNKPSFKGYFLVINRSYKVRENINGEWKDKIDPKTKQPMVEPRLQALGRGSRDLNVLLSLNKKLGGIKDLAFEVTKTGEGTQSALQFLPKDRDRKVKYSKAELELIAGRNEEELRELIGILLSQNKSEIADPIAEKKPDVGEEVDWNDGSENFNMDD